CCSVGTDRRLHDVRDEPAIVRLVKVLELLPRELLVLREIEVAPVVNTFDLLEAQGAAKIELYVEGRARVVCELLFGVLMELQALSLETQCEVPLHPLLLPVLEPLHVGARLDEELHLHLLELARAEDEIPGRDLVAERLPDLRDAEWDFLTRRLLDVQEIHVDALRGPGPQVPHRRGILHRPHERLEHQIELARFAERPLHPAGGALRVGRARRALDSRIIGAKPLLAVFAIDERIDESTDVSARLPDAWMHQDRGIEPLDVISRANH